MKKPFLWGCVAAVAASATFPTWADTHTVASGETETLSNVTETSRFVKNGEGTLGKLATDSTMYDEVQGAIKDVRQVLDNYRDTTPISTFGSLIMGGL